MAEEDSTERRWNTPRSTGFPTRNCIQVIHPDNVPDFDLDSDVVVEVEFPRTFDISDVLDICQAFQLSSDSNRYKLWYSNCYSLAWTIITVLARQTAGWDQAFTASAWAETCEQVVSGLSNSNKSGGNESLAFRFEQMSRYAKDSDQLPIVESVRRNILPLSAHVHRRTQELLWTVEASEIIVEKLQYRIGRAVANETFHCLSPKLVEEPAEMDIGSKDTGLVDSHSSKETSFKDMPTLRQMTIEQRKKQAHWSDGLSRPWEGWVWSSIREVVCRELGDVISKAEKPNILIKYSKSEQAWIRNSALQAFIRDRIQKYSMIIQIVTGKTTTQIFEKITSTMEEIWQRVALDDAKLGRFTISALFRCANSVSVGVPGGCWDVGELVLPVHEPQQRISGSLAELRQYVGNGRLLGSDSFLTAPSPDASEHRHLRPSTILGQIVDNCQDPSISSRRSSPHGVLECELSQRDENITCSRNPQSGGTFHASMKNQPSTAYDGVLTDQGIGTISSITSLSDVMKRLANHGCPDITSRIDFAQCTRSPIAGGGFGDIYKGRLLDGTDVALKCSRLFFGSADEGQKTLKRTARELYSWSKFKHKNVIELLGLATFREQVAMVSPWMKNGNLPAYLAKNPNVDRCMLCIQVAEGLVYLHNSGTVHGDLKGLNVLVAEDGTAKLTDFGNAVLEHYSLQFTATGPQSNHSLRWAAPELLRGEVCSVSADVYALGMTILEIITGKLPYSGKTSLAVLLMVAKNELPERPLEFIPHPSEHGDILWAALVKCWNADPGRRPGAAEVMAMIENVTQEGLGHIVE